MSKPVIVRPYIPGKGLPSFAVDLDQGAIYLRTQGKRTRIAHWNPADYRPGLFRDTPRKQAEDVVDFFLAYVESPAGYDRSPEEEEQVHAAEWRQHGDALSSALTDPE